MFIIDRDAYVQAATGAMLIGEPFETLVDACRRQAAEKQPQRSSVWRPCARSCGHGALTVDALGSLAEQTAFRRDPETKAEHVGGPGRKLRWGISPSIERARAAREEKPKPKPVVTKPPPVESAVNPPTVSTCIARPVTGYKGLIEACRQRANELALSRLELDRISGVPWGYSAKLLGKDDGILRKKKMWPSSLEAILGALGLQIIIIEDHAATSLTLSRRIPVDHCNQRFDNKCNSKPVPQLGAPTKEPAAASRSHLRVVQGKRRGSKYG